jgi:hypothetical protein
MGGMRSKVCCWLLLLCACHSYGWKPTPLPRCAQRLPDAAEEHERTELAAMVGAQSRGFAVTQSSPAIVVESDAADQRTRFSLAITPHAIEVDSLHEDRRAQGRFRNLSRGLADNQCRTLDALRAEAHLRGFDVGIPDAHSKRMLELYDQSAALHLGRKIAFVGVAAGVFAAGVSLMLEGLLLRVEGCEECLGLDPSKLLIYSSLFPLAIGSAMLAVSLPRLFNTLHKKRELGRELKLLREPQLSLGAGSFSLRTRF